MEDTEKLLLQLPEAMFGLLVAEAGGLAQQELSQLQTQLLTELDAAMHPAAANRAMLHPTLAQPSRCLSTLSTQQRCKSLIHLPC